MVRKSNTKPHIHFLGIGGSGASAAAAIAQAYGYQISGCDKHPQTELTRVFDKKVLFEGHSPSHLTGGKATLLSEYVSELFHNPTFVNKIYQMRR